MSPQILEATKTDKTLAATDKFPEKVVWKLRVQTPEGEKEADILMLPTDSAPSGDVELEPSQYGLKAKFPRRGGRPGGGGNYNDPKRLRGENYRSALHAAISWADIKKDIPLTTDQLIVIANKFYDAIEQKAQVGQ